MPKSNLKGLSIQTGYFQAWPRIWTRDYREQIQLALKSGTWTRGFGIRIGNPAL